ncbi:8-oxo-dGTP diphosphatase MutT [Pontibacter brevis]
MLKVTCAIIEKGNRVLVTQRSAAMREPLLWEFPGGKVEPGETEEECLVREIREELHLEVKPLQRMTPVLHRTPIKAIELIPYICTVEGGEIRLLEHCAFEWTVYDNLRMYEWCLPDLPVVEEYLRLKKVN